MLNINCTIESKLSILIPHPRNSDKTILYFVMEKYIIKLLYRETIKITEQITKCDVDNTLSF